MIKAPYTTELYDPVLRDYIIPTILKTLTKSRDDDFMLFICGLNGSGKSTLGLHILQAVLQDRATVECIGLDRAGFARALKFAKSMEKPRVCFNDEANVSKRDATSFYNKRLLDLYFSIRGLNILHIWSNPALDIIDKPFIELRISGVMFVASKDINRPRVYYYFTKKRLLKIWEKHKDIKLSTLRKEKDLAFYRGWFRDFPACALKHEYSKLKEHRMSFKVDEFYREFGDSSEGFVPVKDVAGLIGVSVATIKNYYNELVLRGEINPDTDVQKLESGRVRYSRNIIPLFKKLAREKYEKNLEILRKGREKREEVKA